MRAIEIKSERLWAMEGRSVDERSIGVLSGLVKIEVSGELENRGPELGRRGRRSRRVGPRWLAREPQMIEDFLDDSRFLNCGNDANVTSTAGTSSAQEQC